MLCGQEESLGGRGIGKRVSGGTGRTTNWVRESSVSQQVQH